MAVVLGWHRKVLELPAGAIWCHYSGPTSLRTWSLEADAGPYRCRSQWGNLAKDYLSLPAFGPGGGGVLLAP